MGAYLFFILRRVLNARRRIIVAEHFQDATDESDESIRRDVPSKLGIPGAAVAERTHSLSQVFKQQQLTGLRGTDSAV